MHLTPPPPTHCEANEASDVNPPADSETLGSWEVHTRGIGSQLLKSMGYSGVGGLGVSGSGRPFPVALILDRFQVRARGWNKRPSLDHVVSGKGKRRMKRIAGAARKRLHSAAAAIGTSSSGGSTQKGSSRYQAVFDLINSALSSTAECSQLGEKASTSTTTTKRQLTDHELRVQLFQTQEQIGRIQLSIRATKQSIERNEGRDRMMFQRANQRLAGLESELARLRKEERSFEASKKKELKEKKLRIF